MTTRSSGQSVPLILTMTAALSVMVLAAVSLYQSRTGQLEGILAERHALYAAHGAFNLGVAKLGEARTSLAERWYAAGGADKGLLTRDFALGTMETLVSDVHEPRGELDHFHVVGRARAAVDGRGRSAMVFGTVRLIRGVDEVVEASVGVQHELEPRTFGTLVDENLELFRGEMNPAVAHGLVGVSVADYDARLDNLIRLVKARRFDDIDLRDPTTAASLVALFERYADLFRLFKIARLCNDLVRDGLLAELPAAAGTGITREELLELLRSIEADGPPLTTERAEFVLGHLSRSQVELLVVHVTLQKLQALEPPGVRLKVGGTWRSGAETALFLARGLHTSIMGAETTEAVVPRIVYRMLRAPEKLDRVNVLERFVALLHQTVGTTTVTQGGIPTGAGIERPFRVAVEDRLRVHVESTSRLPLNSRSFFSTRDGVTLADVLADTVPESFTTPGAGGLPSPADGLFQRCLASLPHDGLSGAPTGDGSPTGPDLEGGLPSDRTPEVLQGIRWYLTDRFRREGAPGYQRAAIMAGEVGLERPVLQIFADELQANAVDHGVARCSVIVPPATSPSGAVHLERLVEGATGAPGPGHPVSEAELAALEAAPPPVPEEGVAPIPPPPGAPVLHVPGPVSDADESWTDPGGGPVAAIITVGTDVVPAPQIVELPPASGGATSSGGVVSVVGVGSGTEVAAKDGIVSLTAFLAIDEPQCDAPGAPTSVLAVRLFDVDGSEITYGADPVFAWSRPNTTTYSPARFQGAEIPSSCPDASGGANNYFGEEHTSVTFPVRSGQRLVYSVTGLPEALETLRMESDAFPVK